MTEPTQQLETYVRDHDMAAEVLRLGAVTATVEEAARALGVAPEQIIKSLLFSAADGETVLVIAGGTTRVDAKKVTRITGLRRLRLASPEVALAATGYPAGGIPPVGHIRPLRVVLDRTVLDLPVVYGGGGADGALLRIRPTDILRVTNALVADVGRENSDDL